MYKEFALGRLDKKGNIYIYNSNVEGETRAMSTFFVLEHYPLLHSKKKMSDNIFPFFRQIVDDILAREDLRKEAKITAQDDDYNILSKYATLNQDQDGFWLRNI